MEDNKNTNLNEPNEGQDGENTQQTLSDFDKFLQQPGMQAEFDRRVAKGLETQKKNLSAGMQRQINDAVAAAVKEAQERAAMTAEQQQAYDTQKRNDELAKREAAIARREMRATAREKLTEKGLSSDLVDFLDYTDENSMTQSLEKLAKTYQASIQAGVEAKLKGAAPLEKAKTNTEADVEAQIAAIMKQSVGY